MRACAFFSPSLHPVLDGGKGHKHAVVSPEMPTRWSVGQAVLDHQPHCEIDHAVGVVTARWGKIRQVRIEILATLGAVMLRIGDHEITRTPQGKISQVVQRPLGLLVPIGRVPTTRTRVPLVIAAGGNNLWLGQVGNRKNPFAGIGAIRTGTKHGFVLLVLILGPKLYTTYPSEAIPKPGKDAIVSANPTFPRLGIPALPGEAPARPSIRCSPISWSMCSTTATSASALPIPSKSSTSTVSSVPVKASLTRSSAISSTSRPTTART